ncbi:RHS repeat-associated core domain-containing protein [Photobacterium leiognathi subsp. mandapamensis]|uniref:RHS repeat-associated core domain-containing protein n=1 Tax=Photobacterium leiognathi TaxID=553611 RepID=UPI003AF3A32A
MKKIINGFLLSLPLFCGYVKADAPYLDGDFHVSGGQANYELPLDLPKGRAGHTPSLAIGYNSNGTNQELGLGWGLKGKSTITRCARTLSTDGQWGGIKFDSNDRYCVNGKRLIAITGKDGEHLTEYRTEIDDGNKYVSFNKKGSGPEYFKAWTPSGIEHTFGGTADSRLSLSNNILRWEISNKKDNSNNQIEYKYITDNNVIYLSSISYSGGRANFNYSDRSDYYKKYFLGHKVLRKKRLNDVKIYNAYNQEVSKYTLNYKYADTSGISLVTKISSTISGHELKPIDIKWDYGVQHSGSPAKNILNVTNPILYDKERDGVLDVVSKSNNHALGIWNSTGLKEIKACNSNTGCNVADDNGDGINNLSKSKRHDTNGDGKTDSSGDGDVLDINNDGLLDSFIFRSDSQKGRFSGSNDKDWSYDYSSLYVKFNNKEKFGLLSYCTYIRMRCPSQTADYRYRTGKIRNVKFIDLNNDGYKDILYQSGNYYILLNNGKDYEAPVELNNTSNYISQVIDVNNDGLKEIILKDKHDNNHQIVYLDSDVNKVKAIKNYNGNAYYVDTNSDNIIEKLIVDGNKYSSKITFTSSVFNVRSIESYSDKVTIRYTAISNKNYHKQKNHFDFPVLNSTPSLIVVENVYSRKKGRTHYDYAGAKSHANGGGFLGFESITSKYYSGSGVITEIYSEYEQYRNVGGLIKKLPTGKLIYQSEKRNNKLIREEWNKYTHRSNHGYGGKYSYQILQTENKVQVKDELGKDLGLTQKKYTHNALGRVTKTVTTKSLAGQSKLTQTDETSYVSSGTPSYKVINQAQNTSSSNIARNLADFEHLDVWCGNDNKQYIKPRNKFVHIHCDVVTPILIGSYPYFYRLDVASTSSNITGNTHINKTNYTAVTESQFKSKSPKLCGEYYIYDHNGDGLQDIVSHKGSLVTLISESGREFWKTGAIKQRVTTVSFNGLTQKSIGSMSYDNRGMLLSQITQSSDYGSSSIGAKSLVQQFQYDGYGNVISESTGGSQTGSRTVRTTFDSKGLFPRSSSNSLGHTTLYEYDQRFGLVSKVTDPNNRVTNYAYDSYGRLQQTSLPGRNNWIKYSYKLGSNCEAKASKAISCIVTERNGHGKTFTQFDRSGREVRNIHQSFDGRWVYVDQHWDNLGRKLRHSRPSFDKPDDFMSNVPHSQFSYDSLDRETYSKIPSDSGSGWQESRVSYKGLEETYTESKAGGTYTKTITKNLLGHVVRIDEPLGASQTYTYYPDGKLKTTTDSSNNTTTIQYDNLGYRKLLIDPDLGTLHYDYNAFGELVYKRDANGKTTRITYDQLGRKIREDVSGIVSTWEYDGRGKGLLHRQKSSGNIKNFFYRNGLLVEEKMEAKGQTLVQRYEYDDFERIAQEIRPNNLVLQYVYNEFGYHSAVRSPKSAADSIFTSLSFQQDVRALINDASSQAQKYLNLANRYAQQRDFYNRKASEIRGNSVDVHELDSQSLGLLNGAQRFRKYCNSAGTCYLQPATWLILHDDVSIPLDVNIDKYYRLTKRYSHSKGGNKYYDATVYETSSHELNRSGATQQDDWVLKDHDDNGSLDLIAGKHLYGAYKDASTSQEINFTAQELVLASEIANARYKTYSELAGKLVSLSQEVAKLSGLYKQDIQKVAKQKTHLQTIIRQSELAKANKDAFIYYWQRTNTDAYYHTTSEVLGNGLANSYVHSEKTGRAKIIATHKASKVTSRTQLLSRQFARDGYRHINYNYDNWGNVTQRYDRSLGLNERFTYDLLDRVTSATPMLDDRNQHGAGNPDFNRRFDYRYDKLGNITYKTGVGQYYYRSSHKHAVTQAGDTHYTYDAAGNMVRATKQGKEERSIVWTSFNKPQRITRNGHTTSFEYDANHARFYREDSSGKQTLYFGKTYEQVVNTKTKRVEHKQYIYADGKLIALHVSDYDNQRNLRDKQIRYMHYDALSSVDLITDGYGNIVERRSFDAWGKARKLLWQDTNNPATLLQLSLTTRGFTGHEHLEEVGLIHMNGRVYDADIGRFISPDPIIQAPFMTNSFNRYSYVMNNPLKYIDPTGYFWGGDSDVHEDDWSPPRDVISSPIEVGGDDGTNDNGSNNTQSDRRESNNNKEVTKKTERTYVYGAEFYKQPSQEERARSIETLVSIGMSWTPLGWGLDYYENQVEISDILSDIHNGGPSAIVGGVYQIAGIIVASKVKKLRDFDVTNNAKAIKNARQRGVNRAKSAERDLVKSGHPGTADNGGWSFAERKRIAETGQFPSDTRWHHINDVKRNPGQADVADNVIPSRGGNAGHVSKYHPNGTQAGSSGSLLNRRQLKNNHMNGN